MQAFSAPHNPVCNLHTLCTLPPAHPHPSSSRHPPPQGPVCGVLYYFPFQNDAETVPVENPLTSTKPVTSPFHPGGATQRPGATQLQRATQAPRATQLNGGGAGGLAAMEEDEDDEGPDAWQTAPIFEAFWQGRLIPGARIDTLPFVEAVRQKRTAQGKVGSHGSLCRWRGRCTGNGVVEECMGISSCARCPSTATAPPTSAAGRDPRRGVPPPAWRALLRPCLPCHPQQA